MSTKKLQIIGSLGNSDADTLDGKHASEFASASDITALEGLVGDTKVATQITTAINNIDYPVDSVNGKTGAVVLSASDVNAYTKTQVDNLELITVDDIDTICGTTIQVATLNNEVRF